MDVVTGYKALTYHHGNMLSYHKGKLYLEREGIRRHICDIPLSGITKVLSKIRLCERLLRLEPRVACMLGDNQYLLSCSGKIYRIDTDQQSIYTEFVLRPRMNNPLAFTKEIDCTGGTRSILFGEYFSNNACEKVSIYERRSDKWKEIYSFDPGRVYHIHGIVQGKEEDTFFVLTGDTDEESGIWLTRDHFKTLVCIVGGSQQYRSCVAFPFKDGLLYATDTPREMNSLFYLYFEDGIWKTDKIYEMPGPCIYGTKRKGRFVFATSVEADDTLPAWRYRFSKKFGAGVKDNYSHLISVKENGDISEECRLKKDCLPMLLFQFGNCMFPDANDDDPVVITPISVSTYDGKTLVV